MTSNAEPQPSPPTPTWQLVHAEPGALVYAVLGVKPATHPMVRRAAGRPRGGWLPSGTPASHHQAGKHSALAYAGYIGRVGLLAAALGVGAAVVGIPGIAWAGPTDADSSTSTSTSTSTETESESSPTAETQSAPASVVSSSGGAQPSTTGTSAPTAAETSASSGSERSVTVSAPGSTSPPVVVRSSGGAQTSTSESSTAPAAQSSAQRQADPSEGITVKPPTAPTTSPSETVTTPQLPTEAEAPTADTRAAAPDAPAARVIPAGEGPAEAVRGPRHTAAPPAAPAAAPPVSKLAIPEGGVRPGPPPVRMPSSVRGVPTAAAADFSTVQPSAAAESASASAPEEVARVPVVDRIVAAVLSPFTAPTASPAATAVETPVLWGMFAWMRRTRFNQAANVSAPTETTQVDDTSSDKSVATDADGLTPTQPDGVLSFDVAGGPAKGSVTLDPAGAFTYTSTTGHAAALQDNFAVTVNDADGGTTTVPVAVAIDPADAAPVMSLAVSDPNEAGGPVNVSVTVTDPDTDPVTYLVVHDPSYGTPTPTLAAAELMSAPTAAVTTPEYPATTRTPVLIGTQTFFIEYVTGPGNLNQTDQRFNIGGTDLGIMWDNGIEDDPTTPVNEHQVLIAFGDTFANSYPPRTGFWRMNTLLRTPDNMLSNGLYVPNTAPGDIYSGSSTIGSADPKEIVDRNNIAGYAVGPEVSIIPTAGISVTDASGHARQYVNFMSVRSWDQPGQWTTNYSGIAYSDDNGQTWQVADSSIRAAAPGRSIKPFVAGNENFQMGAFVKGVQVDANGEPLRDAEGRLLTDGYVYSYGTPSGRLGTMYLSRVEEADVLDQTKYEYWNGTTWVANTPSAASPLLAGTTNFFGVTTYPSVSEMSVQYNEYLNKYIVMYDDGANIVVRTAYKPEGPWSSSTTLVTTSQLPGKYAPMIHPWSGTTNVPEAERRYLFWNVSTWDDYEARLMRTDLSTLTLAPTPTPGQTPTPTPTPAPAPGGCGGAAALSVALAAASVYSLSRLRGLLG